MDFFQKQTQKKNPKTKTYSSRKKKASPTFFVFESFFLKNKNDINKIEEYLLFKEDFFTKTVSSLTDEQEKNIPLDGWNFI